VSPESVTVGSKWGYTYTANWKIEAKAHEVKEHSLATLERQLPENLASLNGYFEHLPDPFGHDRLLSFAEPPSVYWAKRIKLAWN
jgi:hypothetical protein